MYSLLDEMIDSQWSWTVCSATNKEKTDEVGIVTVAMQVWLDVAVVFPVGRNGYISSCRSI